MPVETSQTIIPELSTTAVNLDGLLKVLGDNLYSTPSIAIRELIQNTHDACIRRQIEDTADFAPNISLTCDLQNRRLVFEDNGAGLTHGEIREFLATIGSGYSSELRDTNPNANVIGCFGLGFLSAYTIADTVELTTTSYKSPHEAWAFQSSGGRCFAVTPADPRPIGTRIVLRLNAQNASLASQATLAGLIARFCPLLPIPITLNGAAQPDRAITAPWNTDLAAPKIRHDKIRQDFAESFDRSFSPLCSWDLQDNDLDLEGVLWIQDGRSYASADSRAVSIFVRNMLITEECSDLLPSWASFVGCVVNSRRLTPTASREDVKRDEAFEAIRDLIRRSLLEGLQDLPHRQPEIWRRVTRRHNDALRGAAIVDPHLFDLLHDTLLVPTSLGDLPLARLAQASGGRLLMRMDDCNTHEAMLFRARSVPTALGYRYAVAPFCRRYAEKTGLPVIELGSTTARQTLFPDRELDAAQRARLARHLLGADERLVLSAFEPSTIPFIFVTDEAARLKRRIEDDQADARIGPPP